MSLVVRWFIKFSVWSFKEAKEITVPFTKISSNIYLLCKLDTFFADLCSNVFNFFFISCCYSVSQKSLLFSLYILDVSTFFISSGRVFWNSFYTFWNFNSFTLILLKSSSNWIRFLLVRDLYCFSNHN